MGRSISPQQDSDVVDLTKPPTLYQLVYSFQDFQVLYLAGQAEKQYQQ